MRYIFGIFQHTTISITCKPFRTDGASFHVDKYGKEYYVVVYNMGKVVVYNSQFELVNPAKYIGVDIENQKASSSGGSA